MEKAKLKNKAVQDILEDAKDGRLKKESIEKVKEVLKEEPKKVEEPKGQYIYAGIVYKRLDQVPVPKSQREDFVKRGLIKPFIKK